MNRSKLMTFTRMLSYERSIFIIFLFGLVVFTQTYSISQMGDMKIVKTNDKWICDMLECPPDSERCFVSKSNEEQPSVLKRVNICFSQNNTILAQKNTYSAINPNLRVRQYMNSYRSGSFSSLGTDSDFNQAEFEENLRQNMNHVQSNLQNMYNNINNNINLQRLNLQTSLRDMQLRLANMFGDFS